MSNLRRELKMMMESADTQQDKLTGERLQKEVASCKEKVAHTPFSSDEQVLELYMDYVCGLTLLAEDHLNNQYKEWEISSLASEFMEKAPLLKAYKSCHEVLYHCASRLSDVLYNHPRLKVRLLEFQLSIGKLIEEDTEELESLGKRIATMNANIFYSDNKQTGRIVQTGHLKVDPVEWTQQWEDVIDEVEQEVAGQLEDRPRSMGFCFIYWSAKQAALARKGVSWQSPSAMNPNVFFD